MKHFDLVQTYLANLNVLFVKLHNVHWNVVGSQFLRIHTFTEELYDQIFEDFDAVAELLKAKGVMPLSTTKEYLERATIAEVAAKDFSSKESLDLVKGDLAAMRDLATEIRNSADEAGDFETVGMFEDYVAFYSKNLWFVEAMMR
ncbi:MAG: DNA starvation/stationary phase protection protein [Sphaerochaeta sp.]|jgi:starvation-inducible DNA-binding protein|nr:DNA starvation/stationary phase protection protein [Sphaerochaeta sp.]MDX9915452.1 DNA starvation/stationary phase protection protein [Sphaerochaeta sp.]